MAQRNIFNYESLVHATAGATGSIFAMTSVYPLDMIKFRKQLEDKEVIGKTTFEAIIHLLKNEGIASLYRGIRPVVITLGVSTFVYFYTFHGIKSVIPKELQNSKTDLALSIFSGVVNVLTTNPLWVVNNRLKTKEEVHYTGLLDGLFHIGSTEGIGTLWNGVGPSLILVTNPAIHFTIYEALKRKVNVKTATAFFILGAISKSIATVLTYPLQLAQTRLRLAKDRRMGTAALLFMILKKNGPKALFQGLESKMLQTVFATALMFVTYEKLAQLVFKLLLGSAKRKRI
ncbi:peroxisomal Membrane Protein 34 [Leptinotarsa decemlineata]|uniref:peroxisomal Membrane Protein 34 n=1 Tax=Leptinotarsa decemlineata TaxID=7539 RepID=UPI000C25510B|nr:peroxisomal membrane protein PMP34 [Leptinotarsa decemlineata]